MSIYAKNLQSVEVDCRYTDQNHHHYASDQYGVREKHDHTKSDQNIYMKHSGGGKDERPCLGRG